MTDCLYVCISKLLTMNKNLLKAIISLFALLPQYLLAQSVLYVSPSGSDAANNCDLPNNPCKTIEYTYSIANAGDTVKIGAGNYNLAATLDVNQAVVLMALDTNNKPVITSGAADVISVNSDDVTINGLVFKMGLTNTSGMRGVVSNQMFFNKLRLENNTFESTNPISGTPNTNMVWNAFAIYLASASGNSDTVSILNNNIIASNTSNIFGRGIYLGHGQASLKAPGGIIDGNKVTAYYTIQSVLNNSNTVISNNQLNGITMINAPEGNSTIDINNNILSGATQMEPSSLYAIAEIRGNYGANVEFKNNTIKDYSTIGLLSSASLNVNVIANIFTPADTASDFISLMANTKLMTSAVQANTYSDEITIQGNTFNAGVVNKGTGIVFADHYGKNTQAFSKIVIGGASSNEKNIFASDLEFYIVLDDQTGSSSGVDLWNGYDVTIMQPFSQRIVALFEHNNYNKNSIAEVELKNIDSLDNNALGKIYLGENIGVNEQETVSTSLYPNPAADFITLDLNDETKMMQVSIVNVSGTVVLSTKVAGKQTIDISALSSGVYFVKVNGDNHISSTKFIKK